MNRGDSITWRWSGAGRHELGDRRSRPGRELQVRPRPSARRHQPRSRGDLPTRRERRVRSATSAESIPVHARQRDRGAVPDNEAPRIYSLRTPPWSAPPLPGVGTSEPERPDSANRDTSITGARPNLEGQWAQRRNEVRLATARLRPARYRVTLRATDAVGNVSKPARASFAARRASKAGHRSSRVPILERDEQAKVAFVLSGGASRGAIRVGILRGAYEPS